MPDDVDITLTRDELADLGRAAIASGDAAAYFEGYVAGYVARHRRRALSPGEYERWALSAAAISSEPQAEEWPREWCPVYRITGPGRHECCTRMAEHDGPHTFERTALRPRRPRPDEHFTVTHSSGETSILPAMSRP